MTRNDIVELIKQEAKEKGLINITRAGVCERMAIPDGSFQHYAGCTFSELVGELIGSGELNNDGIPVNRAKADARLRYGHILHAAVEVAERDGFTEMTRENVATHAGVSPSLVSRYFPTSKDLKKAIMTQAVAREILSIVAQGLAVGLPEAKAAPMELKQRAVNFLMQ